MVSFSLCNGRTNKKPGKGGKSLSDGDALGEEMNITFYEAHGWKLYRGEGQEEGTGGGLEASSGVLRTNVDYFQMIKQCGFHTYSPRHFFLVKM